ncbi:MAG: alpha/beta hydrolase [Chloroflexota bacterium]
MRKLFGLVLIFCMMLTVSAQDEDITTAQDLADENGQFVMVDDVELYYVTEGDNSNPAVILIHGFGGSTFTWRDNISVIADAGYYVVALDLPPFGLSDKSAEISHTREAYADYVVGLMDSLAIERASIVGHSMGGGVTAYLAVTHPERVDKLVFVAGGVASEEMETTETDADASSPLGAFASLDLDPDGMVQIIENTLVPATFASLIESAYYDASIMTDEVIAGYARPIQIDGWANGFVAYWLTEDSDSITLDDFVEAIDVPVLIIWGEEDTWVPISMGFAMNDALDNTILITYPQVGHVPMEETVEAFNSDLIAFLEGN